MATIKIRRGSGQPAIGGSGLTAYEPAWDTVNNRFFINSGNTAMWIGAAVIQDTTLSGNCAWTIPTQNSVKTYVDNQFAGGAVSSVDGVTGAVDLLAGTGISITNPTGAAKGITLAVNSNVALLDTAQTFTALKSFSAGISASGGTFSGRLNVLPASGSNAFINTSSGSLLYVGTTGGAAFAVDGGNNELEFWANGTLQGYFNTSGLFVTNGLGSIAQVPTISTTVASLNGATGTVTIGAGTGLSVATSVSSRGITFTNTGVTGLTGTVNQITVSGTTGSITLSLPSAITVPGSLATTTTLSVGTDATISGNLTVNGTTTTVNSTTVTVQDPIIAIGGVTGNGRPVAGDVKDRGILFQYNTTGAGATGATGFFGLDQSGGVFTFIPLSSQISPDIITGTAGTAEFSQVRNITALDLIAYATGNAQISLAGNTAATSTSITNSAFETILTNSTGTGRLSFTDSSFKGTISPPTYTSNRTYSLPNWSGQVGVWATAPVQGRILLGDVSGSAPYWADPTGSGFTAFAAINAENLRLTATSSNTNFNLTFATGNSGLQLQYADLSNNLTWNPSTGTLTLANGRGFLEGVVDGGAF